MTLKENRQTSELNQFSSLKGGQLNIHSRDLSSVKKINKLNALIDRAFQQEKRKSNSCDVKEIKKNITNFHKKHGFSLLLEEPILTIYFKHGIRLLLLYNITTQSPKNFNCEEVAELLDIVSSMWPDILAILEKNLNNAVEILQYEEIADENVIKEIKEFLNGLKTCIKFNDKNVVNIRFENINTLLGLHDQISKDSNSDDELEKIRENVGIFLKALQNENQKLTSYVNTLKKQCSKENGEKKKKRNSVSTLEKSATPVPLQKKRKLSHK